MTPSQGLNDQVTRVLSEREKTLVENDENVRKTQVLCFQPVKEFLKIRVFAAVGL